MSEVFRLKIEILFQHCDPAGIVFFPRYFEMLNQTMEKWCAQMGEPFSKMLLHNGRGIPTAAIAAEFHAPSRLGDVVEFALTVTRIGRTSAGLAFRATCEDELRVTAHSTIVQFETATRRPVPWDQPFRAQIERFLDPAPDTAVLRAKP